MSTTRPCPAGGDRGPRPAEPPLQVRRLRLVGIPGTVSRAREFTREALLDWGWLPAATAEQRAAAEDVLLVVSELVTNACLHAGGPEELCLAHTPKLIRVEVSDRGAGTPVLRLTRRAGRPGGHGMFIVQRLCLDWGVVGAAEAREAGGYDTAGPDGPAAAAVGKTVWAELAAPQPEGPDRPDWPDATAV